MPADLSTMLDSQGLYNDNPLLQGHKPPILTYRDQVWWWRHRLYVPSAMCDLLLKQYHEKLAAGHWGSLKTLDILTQTFGCPGMQRDVWKCQP